MDLGAGLQPLKGGVIKTKHCGTCKTVKPLDEFRNRTSVKDGKQSVCINCDKARQKEYYLANKERDKLKFKKRKEKSKLSNYAFVNEIKSKTPCKDCGRYFDPICMDFDHISNDKFLSISELCNSGYSKEMILNEISKCELVCACCHRIRTRNRLQCSGDGTVTC